MEVRLTILGEPMQWKAANVVWRKNINKRIAFSDDRMTAHKALIRRTWMDAGSPAFEKGALALTVTFYVTRPKSHPKNWRTSKNRHLYEFPITRPDRVNMTKLCEDALNKLAFEDDAWIIEAHSFKRYAEYPDSPARTEMTICEVSPSRPSPSSPLPPAP